MNQRPHKPLGLEQELAARVNDRCIQALVCRAHPTAINSIMRAFVCESKSFRPDFAGAQDNRAGFDP